MIDTEHSVETGTRPHFRLDFDNYLEDYIDDPQALEPLHCNPSRPGQGIVMHGLSSIHKPFDAEHIVQEGLLSPRRYAVLSAFPFLWAPDDRSEMIIFRTHTRFSREFPGDTYYGVIFREGNIGLDVNTVKIRYPDLYNKQLQNELTRTKYSNTWAFVPPSHIIGRLRFNTGEAKKAFHRILDTVALDYLHGDISERDIPLQLEQTSALAIDIQPTDTTNTLWKSLGAGISESALLLALHRFLNPTFKISDGLFSANEVDLAKIQTSFPWSKKTQRDFLTIGDDLKTLQPEIRKKAVNALETVIQMDRFIQ